jgi:uncharacterized FlaG/YvyC family protein
MELTGIGIKNPLATALEWSGRVPATPEKEALPSAAKKGAASPESTGLSERLTHQQEAVKAVTDRLEAFLDATRYSLEFIPNPENGQVTIRVLNSAGKVIRQIPPEEINRFALQTASPIGLLVDEKLG